MKSPKTLVKTPRLLLIAGLATCFYLLFAPVQAKGESRSIQQTSGLASINGLRSARFGMTEQEVRRSIETDFPGSAHKTHKQIHPLEHTIVLNVPVDNFLDGSGLARVIYIFGYESKKLAQINVVWNRKNNNENIQKLTALLFALKDYFLKVKFSPESIVIDKALPNGSVLGFRGIDSKGSMVTVVGEGLSPVIGEDGKPRKTQAKTVMLTLSYIKDPQSPDVYKFEIEKGKL